MESRLDCINDWNELAHQVAFSAQVLAVRLRVSERHLRRYFSERFSESPQHYLNRLRLNAACQALASGECVKVVADLAGYKRVSHFSREFKKAFGVGPSKYGRTTGRSSPISANMSVLDNKWPQEINRPSGP